MSHHSTLTAPDEIERLIFHMPEVARMAENDWAAGFAKSVIRQSRRRGWNPSLKQLSIMRKLISDLFTNCEELELIDNE